MALKLPSVKALPPITLEQLAEVTARIDTGTPREEALRDARVPAEMWELAQHTWASLIAEDDAHKKPSLRTRFAGLLAEYRAKALHQRDTGDQPRIKGLVDAEQKRTIALSVVPEPGDDGLPFQAPPAAPQLTLAQYARVCVEMWKAPARGAEICARYGIPDAQAWAAVNQLWQERIHSDPTLQQRWIKLTDRMRTPRTQR